LHLNLRAGVTTLARKTPLGVAGLGCISPLPDAFALRGQTDRAVVAPLADRMNRRFAAPTSSHIPYLAQALHFPRAKLLQRYGAL